MNSHGYNPTMQKYHYFTPFSVKSITSFCANIPLDDLAKSGPHGLLGAPHHAQPPSDRSLPSFLFLCKLLSPGATRTQTCLLVHCNARQLVNPDTPAKSKGEKPKTSCKYSHAR